MELNIKGDLTVDEIHRIREYNYETTRHMTKEERRNFYKSGSEKIQKRIEELRKQN